MGYCLAVNIRNDRIAKSLEAYNKYVERNGVPTEAEMNELRIKFNQKDQSRLYWWSLKVYNGWLYTTKKRLIWG